MPGTRFTLEVQPRIPPRIQRLEDLANDLFYSWDEQVRSLFRRLDGELWESCRHNPKMFLRRIAQERLEQAAHDRVFIQDYNRVLSSYDIYIREENRAGIEAQLTSSGFVAYFCAEFGFHESFPIYSGGLGILAADHCKAASDLGLPFVGVGLLYRQGYFTQTIDGHGEQVAHYRPTDFADLPVTPAMDEDDDEIRVQVQLQRRQVDLKIWVAKVGHIRLYLLDSDLPSNTENDRAITYQLYGGDAHTRIQQEMVLGIGGVRALRALGYEPTVWHINEGHPAFQIVERIREQVAAGLEFASALEQVASATVFTTHTPVPAGHDIFPLELLRDYFAPYLPLLKIEEKEFLALGSSPSNPHGFNMTAFALRCTRFHNGVSRIHGNKASQMEGYIWPQVPAEENPIGYVTNGIHIPTFLASEWVNLLDMQFGGGWRNELTHPDFWERIHHIPDYSFWSVRRSLKAQLLDEARERYAYQCRRNGLSESQIERMTRFLSPTKTDILVLGFARRFATYKRATLLFLDAERLARLLNDPARPVIIIFAGKAHPQDQPGQQLIKEIHEYSRRSEFEGKIILLENYDMALGRKLFSGVDVWLNNPEYPLEASGTSGQKAGANGVINLSVTDGWWGEGYNGENGWAITPHGPQFDPIFRNCEEADELLDLLENAVVPLYYERNGHGYSEGWVAKSKASMRSILPRFNAQRMLMEYLHDYYARAQRQQQRLADGGGAGLLASWKQKVHRYWPSVRVRRCDTDRKAMVAGEGLPIEIAVRLEGLAADDVFVECLVGREIDTLRSETIEFVVHHTFQLRPVPETLEDIEVIFSLNLHSPLSGLQFYKIRLYPYHPLLSQRFELGYMLWV